ncbi:MAG: GGDEF domain-containing protein [Deltaproteobacteria bacterium]|nr:GGDEF domain-containing protein [Deltaproteobacteria bacterium]MCB9787940.1 GGDEF domain-containing protein [Deltaproteobacteria bacterium]
MMAFDWTRRFVTGIGMVDDQHRRLVELINQLGVSVQRSTLRPDELEQTLQALADYADYHFREEETLMASHAIDERHLDAHRTEHQRFLADVQAMASRALVAPDLGAAASLLDFLVHWLTYHILVQDQSLAAQVACIEAGATPAEAYDQQEREADGATEPLRVALMGLFHQVTAQNQALQDLNRTLEEKVEARTTALSQANSALEVAALTDVLTGLPNRRHGMRRLAEDWTRSVANARPLACLMVDADAFKEVNDSAGHEAGDEVLRRLAAEFQGHVRGEDFVCRLGGDEFMLICRDTDLQGAQRVGEHLLAAVRAMRVVVGTHLWAGSISVGVAARTPEMRGADDLLRAADAGLYVAKQEGRGRLAISPGPDSRPPSSVHVRGEQRDRQRGLFDA